VEDWNGEWCCCGKPNRNLNKPAADRLTAPPPQLSRQSHLSRALGTHQRRLVRIVVASNNYLTQYKWQGYRTTIDAFTYVIVIGQRVAVVIAVDFLLQLAL